MDKVYGLIGLAKRAGKASCGESAVKDSIRFNKAYLTLIAHDASDNTKKSITNSCKYYGVRYHIAGTMDDMGHALGKSFSAAVSITDEGFAKSIDKYLSANTNGGEQL